MAYLDIVEGLDQGRKVELVGDTTIGRAPSNEYCLPDGRASRQHARVSINGDSFLISDLGSANGTFLNRNRINPDVPHPLKNGDEIVICGTRIIFRTTAPGMGRPVTSVPGAPNLSLVMTDEAKSEPAVNASIDASISMIDIREEERQSTAGLEAALKRLQAMVKVSAELGEITDRKTLFSKIMNNIFKVFPQAERAFIMMRDKGNGEMMPVSGRERDAKIGQTVEMPISRTILNAVVNEKRSILSNDAQDDFGAQQSIVNLSIRGLMCVPFIYENELLGVINVDTSSALEAFSSDDLAMLTGIAAQAAIALKNQELVEEIENETQTRAQLSRYISPDVVEGVLDGTIPLQLGAEKKNGTIFFCDIVGFTAMSEKLTAIEVVDKLNRYFQVTTEIVTRNKGTLHKFGGDMIMAFWNVLLPDDSAEYNAIRTSIEMQAAVWSFDLDLIQQDQKPVYLGIGCNTGEFAGGNIGGDRIEYTIIGDNVNLGQRIESMAGRWQVFVSESTYEPVRDMCIAIGLPPVMVKGKSQPIKIYSIRGLQTGAEELTLNIPVDVFDARGEDIGMGIITASNGIGADTKIHFSTAAEIKPGEGYTLIFDTPELKREFRLVGIAEISDRSIFDGSTEYTRATIGNIEAEDGVMELFSPGALVESQRSWVEMKRK